MSGIRFDFDERALDDLLHSEEVEDMLQDVGDEVADNARPKAPAESGESAASIHSEVHRGADSSAFASTYTPEDDLPTAYVSWDQDHFWLLFAEVGTEHQPARPFLRPALDETNI